jgi:hypothetical protein
MSLILAGSISLDSAFKLYVLYLSFRLRYQLHIYLSINKYTVQYF